MYGAVRLGYDFLEICTFMKPEIQPLLTEKLLFGDLVGEFNVLIMCRLLTSAMNAN